MLASAPLKTCQKPLLLQRVECIHKGCPVAIDVCTREVMEASIELNIRGMEDHVRNQRVNGLYSEKRVRYLMKRIKNRIPARIYNSTCSFHNKNREIKFYYPSAYFCDGSLIVWGGKWRTKVLEYARVKLLMSPRQSGQRFGEVIALNQNPSKAVHLFFLRHCQ